MNISSIFAIVIVEYDDNNTKMIFSLNNRAAVTIIYIERKRLRN